MSEKPLITIIVATFNSGKFLPAVLKAIKQQSYPQDKIEILLLDGGSQDDTFEIGKKYGCQIVNNPRTEPVYAKYLGYRNARGKYVAYLDHDEIIENPKSLELKAATFESNNRVQAVVGNGYKNPVGYSFINNYINEFGDPFSFFIYRLSKSTDFFIKSMKKKYPQVVETDNFVIFDFSHIKQFPIIELAAMCSMFDAEYMKKEFPETLEKPELLPHYFYLLISKSPFMAITKNDAIIHYSSDTFRKYLNKIRWRVKNNIYHLADMGISGFSGREKFQPIWLRYKKYFFIPYSLTLILPLIDVFYLVITRRKALYLIHPLLCFYTSILILYHYCCKILGGHEQLKSYDESKIIINHIKH